MDQGIGIGGQAARFEVVRRTHECDVEGCGNLVMDGTRCAECVDQLRALDEYAAAERERRAARVARWMERCEALFETWLWFWDWARKVDWVSWALGIFIVFVLSSFAYAWAAALLGVE